MTREESEYEDYRNGAVDFDFDSIDGPEEEQSLRATDESLLVSTISRVVWELAKWAGNDPVKNYAAQVALRQIAPDTAGIATRLKVSDSLVRRRVRQALNLIRSGEVFLKCSDHNARRG